MTMETDCAKHEPLIENGDLGDLCLSEQLLHSDEGSCSATSGDDVKRAASGQDGDDEEWCLDGVDIRRHLQVSVDGGTGDIDDFTSTGDVVIVNDDTSCPPSSSLPDYGHPHPAMTSLDAKDGSTSLSSDPSGGGHCNSEYCLPLQSSSEFAYLRPPSDHFSSPPFVVSTSFAAHEVYWHYNPGPDIYSRKAFVGGLTANLGQDELYATFRRFGPLYIDLPRKQDAKSSPKGYAFLVFENESSIHSLVRSCYVLDNNFYITVSGSNMVQHQVQVKAWRLADANFVVNASMPLDPRKTIFVGGVPRPLKAVELAHLMERVFGSVCYVGIDTDPDLQYPKGAARVSFSTQQSFFTAITTQYIRLNQLQQNKSIQLKPYVLDDQMCDECLGAKCCMGFAPYFCSHIDCLQYYCEECWGVMHRHSERQHHQPMIKETATTTYQKSQWIETDSGSEGPLKSMSPHRDSFSSAEDAIENNLEEPQKVQAAAKHCARRKYHFKPLVMNC